MKGIESMKVREERPWYGCAIAIMVFNLAIHVWQLDPKPFYNEDVHAGVMVLLLAVLLFCLLKAYRQEILREGIYRAYLARFDVNSLIKAASSPELTQRSKEAIAVFLDERLAGWSVCGRAAS